MVIIKYYEIYKIFNNMVKTWLLFIVNYINSIITLLVASYFKQLVLI